MFMGQPYPGLIVPSSTSEWEAMIADVRGHFNADAGELQTVAAILRRELPRATNVQGNRALFGADLKIAAIQIARHINRAAASQNASAAALTKADQIFHGMFVSSSGPGTPRGRFNAGR